MILRGYSPMRIVKKYSGRPWVRLAIGGEEVCGLFSNMSKTIGTPMPRG
jgi:hypothetical protein